MGTIDNNVSQLYDLLNHIPVTKDNADKRIKYSYTK